MEKIKKIGKIEEKEISRGIHSHTLKKNKNERKQKEN